jgi:DNA-directed RNA polymerase specialized sigma24 family protein
MTDTHLTSRQKEVLMLRFERGASIEQIAAWLGISRRAVLHRLRNARRRGGVASSEGGTARQRVRLLAASQMAGDGGAEHLNMDEF